MLIKKFNKCSEYLDVHECEDDLTKELCIQKVVIKRIKYAPRIVTQ